METVHVICDWDRLDEPNGGHTPDEWGIKKTKPIRIFTYKMKWEKTS